jgi:Antibiotic biosynthesis monooxygenase
MDRPRAGFVHLTIHTPRPEHVEDQLRSMRRVAEAAADAPGLLRIGPWRDARSGRLIGLGLWESKDAFDAAMPRVFASLPDEPGAEQWEAQPVEVFHLTPADG